LRMTLPKSNQQLTKSISIQNYLKQKTIHMLIFRTSGIIITFLLSSYIFIRQTENGLW